MLTLSAYTGTVDCLLRNLRPVSKWKLLILNLGHALLTPILLLPCYCWLILLNDTSWLFLPLEAA